MKTSTGVLTAGLLWVGLLAGCSSSSTPTESPSASTSPSAADSSAAATAADKAEAAALETVKRASQMLMVDVFTGKASMNDLPDVLAQPLLDQQRKATGDLLAAGWVAKTGGQVKFDELKVLSATPKSDPTTVIVSFCADATDVKLVREDAAGKVVETSHGVRQGGKATVEAKDYGDGWFVTQTTPEKC